MSFSIPPLPGEQLLTPNQAARRAGCHFNTLYNAIADGRIAAVTVAGRYLIAESEAERFCRQWQATAAGRWRAYRDWQREQAGNREVG
jgi:excisionase family DNA binding protein